MRALKDIAKEAYPLWVLCQSAKYEDWASLTEEQMYLVNEFVTRCVLDVADKLNLKAKS